MRRTIRRAALAMALGAAITLLVQPKPAAAALWLTFEPSAAPPLATISARTLGQGAFRPVPPRHEWPTLYIEVWVMRLGLGQLTIEPDGDGFIVFVVPDVPAGNYTVFADCPTCSHATARVAVGEFRVLSSRPTGSDAAATAPAGGVTENGDGLLGRVLLAVAATAVVAVAVLRRISQRPVSAARTAR